MAPPQLSYTLCCVALQFLSQQKWILFLILSLVIWFDQQNSVEVIMH